MKKMLGMKYVGWFTGLSIMASLVLAYSAMAYEKEISTISVKMAENIAKSGKKRIAVVDFTDLQGNVTELGRFIAEEFSVALLTTGQGFEVVDRTHLQSILKEHKLSATGLIDPQTARKLGQIAGVDALITGTITPFGESVRLSAKILDAETAKIIGANTGDIPKTKAIEELLGKGIDTGNISSSASSTTTTKQATSIVSTDANGIAFKVQSCKLSGTSITCNLIILSNGQDRKFDLHGSDRLTSSIFDEVGNEYKATRVQLGNKTGTGYIDSYLLVADTPTNAVLHFENVSQDTSKISLLQLGCWEEVSNARFTVKLRNITLSK